MSRLYAGRPASEFDFQYIRYDKSGYRATITFNRPEVYNCVNGPMLREIGEALRDVSYDDAIAVLVLTGAGDKAFCTGADLKEQQAFLERPRDYYKWMADFIECHDRLRNLGKPSIARLNGVVVGGGNEFNMSCDLAIAADDIYIRQIEMRDDGRFWNVPVETYEDIDQFWPKTADEYLQQPVYSRDFQGNAGG